jgi:DNA helicase-4
MNADLLLPAVVVASIFCLGMLGMSSLVRRDPGRIDRYRSDLAAALALNGGRRRDAHRSFETLRTVMTDLDTSEFIAQSELDAWRGRSSAAFVLASSPPGHLRHLPPRYGYWARRWMRLIRRSESFRIEANERFKRRRLREDAAFFDNVAGNPLTDRQREAIVSDEDTTLVVAGAGTGKTSVVIGKIAYLLRHKLATPDEILVLSFTKAVQEELLDRLKGDNQKSPVDVRTFHSFGRKTIGDATGTLPTLTTLEPDSFKIKKFIRDRLAEALQDATEHETIVALFSRLMNTDATEVDGAEAKHRLLTLAGVEMDSLQEVSIANWLTLNGIAWEHNRDFEHPTADPDHRQYLPDFYLTDFGIYLEHYGIDRDGKTGRGEPADTEYTQGIQWKRAIHRQYGTRYIETTSDDFSTHVIEQRLTDLLWVFGIEPRPLSESEAHALATAENKVFSLFVELIETFLHLFRGSELTMNDLAARAKGERDYVFLDLFRTISNAYDLALAREKRIDFNDMIIRARYHLRRRDLTEMYRYVIVDEFQDISRTRIGLIQDVRAHTPHARLFAVGDDWQSIYRFSGADLAVMTHLQDLVGTVVRVDLDRTFRFDRNALAASTHFITRNPDQLTKSLTGRDPEGRSKPIWALTYAGIGPRSRDDALRTALGMIQRHRSRYRPPEPASTVFVIGRYNHTRPRFTRHWYDLANAMGLHLEFITAHKSKGLESDYAIVLDFEKAVMGFPTAIKDDPVLNMVLTAPEKYPHAEERRLCYVAMTRARYRTYLLVPRSNPSDFMMSDFWTEAMHPWVETIDL